MDIGGRSSVIVYLLYLPKYYGLERRPNVRFRKLSPLRIRASTPPQAGLSRVVMMTATSPSL